MAFYFKSKKLDISAGNSLVIVLNTRDVHEYGLHQGDKVYLCWHDISLYVSVDYSDSIVMPGELGMFNEVWDKYNIPAADTVSLTIPNPAKSLENIKKKIRGSRLTYEEIKEIMRDVAERRLSTIEMTYFAATSYNPGFNEEEIYFLTKAMAETGDIMDFSGEDPAKKVIDKHSIGGIPSKGVTSVLVPIVATFNDIVVPNTSSRAITTPAGTSDMLEVVMPVALSDEAILRVVKEEGACLVWGGGMHLAPADDILINIQRPLKMESYDSFLTSIVAKKAAMKITHLLIDIPYGPGTKVKDISEVEKVQDHFEKLCGRFGIKVWIYKRKSLSPDGYGVGPLLEIRDVLRIFERHPDRPVLLENLIIDMAGRLLELAEVASPGEGSRLARGKLENGEAEEKFWSIAFAQGAKKKVKSTELIVAEFSHTVNSDKTGIISRIGNRETVDIARALGNPFIKEAGLYFHKLVGDHISKGDPVVTLYATSSERLELGVEVMGRKKDFIVV